MLSQDELTQALHSGLKQAEKCSDTFCRAIATIEDGGYLIAHNGVGSRDTDAQRVHATAVLGKTREQLAERLKTWIAGIHTGVRVDLNAALATGGPISAGVFYLVGECGPELICPAGCGHVLPALPESAYPPGATPLTIATRGPAVLGWPWTT